MPTDRFSETVHLAAPPATLYAHLLDPNSYIGLSPLIVAVRDIRHTAGATSYVAVERFKLGPLHWDNRIRVTLTGEIPDVRLVSHVISPGAVRLTATVDLAPTAGGTSLTESVEVSSPALLRGFVVKQASSVQKARLAELARHFNQ
ncbi:SRPBCC family protein [Paractinoplanes lichenicola]|uniref:SRPBCC family protein n=1 Tax=Paractinoplanes lichenicola TaxID=2802976 RepID=A0ABS1VR54_9ACTN|nr:SRPBCC family protein [Actinoplanes lichenicola]MBL7257200.1 SRPBCC family protein [Actinoplanes lichenicola]